MKNVTVAFGIVCRKEKKNQLNDAPYCVICNDTNEMFSKPNSSVVAYIFD